MIIAALILSASLVHAAPDLQDATTPPAAAQSFEWHAFSRSASTTYLIDLAGMTTTGDTTTIQVAKVPRDKNAPVDIAWRLEDVALRCRAKESKSLMNMEFGADGAELDRYPGDDVWEPVAGSNYLEALHEIACEGARADGRNFPTLAAFMDSPR